MVWFEWNFISLLLLLFQFCSVRSTKPRVQELQLLRAAQGRCDAYVCVLCVCSNCRGGGIVSWCVVAAVVALHLTVTHSTNMLKVCLAFFFMFVVHVFHSLQANSINTIALLVTFVLFVSETLECLCKRTPFGNAVNFKSRNSESFHLIRKPAFIRFEFRTWYIASSLHTRLSAFNVHSESHGKWSTTNDKHSIYKC